MFGCVFPNDPNDPNDEARGMSRYTVRHNVSGLGTRRDVVPSVDLTAGWLPTPATAGC